MSTSKRAGSLLAPIRAKERARDCQPGQACAVLDWRRGGGAVPDWRYRAWRPAVGERVIVIDTNRAAEVVAKLAGDRFEVEPELRLNTLESDNVREVYHLSELRQEYPPH
jgi:hypothetical protein